MNKKKVPDNNNKKG